MFTCKLYKNTGFDAVNVPDSPELLNQFAFSQSQTLDIHQMDHVDTIRIKVSGETDVMDADYLSLSDGSRYAYYSISGYFMTSPDVAELSVVQDSFLTAGGVSGITLVDGMTVRHHVSREDDKFGAYTEEDNLLVPSEPLQVVHSGGYGDVGLGITSGDYKRKRIGCNGYLGMFFDFDDAHGWADEDLRQRTIVMSSVNLAGIRDIEDIKPVTISNDEGTETITYPKIPQSDFATFRLYPGLIDPYSMEDVENAGGGLIYARPYTLNGYCQFEVTDDPVLPDIKDALEHLRMVGMEDAITSAYVLNDNQGHFGVLLDEARSYLNGYSYLAETYGRGLQTDGIDGKKWYGGPTRKMPDSQTYDFLYKSNIVHNLRALTGSTRKYIMVSPATGSSMSANPEDIIFAPFNLDDGGYENNDYAPRLFCITDPRPDGRPYFGIICRRAESNNLAMNAYKNIVPGEKWKSQPIKFTGFSGELQARTGFAIDQYNKDYLASPEYLQRANATGLNPGSALISGVNSAVTNGPVAGAGSAFVNMGSQAIGIGVNNIGALLAQQIPGSEVLARLGNKYSQAQVERERVKAMERSQFELSMAYQTPNIKFQPTETLRDAVGNGVFYARLTPTDNDLRKFDKILDRFGYRITEPVDNSMLTNRSKYNYIEAVGVSVMNAGSKHRLSKRLREDVASQLSNGIRIWHTKPADGFDDNV